MVHRDIKPDNILIDSGGRVMVTDFGIARAISEGVDARLTATGMAIGTPAYMSPEQSMGEREVDGRSDLYSLGVVGYQMLTGELPFNASSTPALLVKHLSEVPQPIQQRCPGVAPDLGRAIMLLLEKEPDNRFPTANALAVALESGNVPEPRAAVVASQQQGGRSLVNQLFPHLGEQHVSGAGVATTDQNAQLPSSEELRRWNAPEVTAFRRKVAPWAFFGVAAIILSLFGVIDVVGIWGMWTIYIAWKYAKLWTDGFDWRDVLKEPRDRMFFDVLAEMADSFRAIWDPRKRTDVRERERIRGQRGSGLFDRSNTPGAVPRLSGSPNDLSSIVGQHARAVSEAARNRDDVLRMIETLPKRDRELLSDIPASASALYQKVESLAVSLAELERNAPPESSHAVDQEIVRLEGEANPLDVVASDERVRRLAFLKRQRRAIADISGRTSVQREKLESCAIALQNMRLDIVRLKSGPQTSEHITSVAEKAIALAREVDTAMYVKEEMSKLGRGQTGSARR